LPGAPLGTERVRWTDAPGDGALHVRVAPLRRARTLGVLACAASTGAVGVCVACRNEASPAGDASPAGLVSTVGCTDSTKGTPKGTDRATAPDTPPVHATQRPPCMLAGAGAGAQQGRHRDISSNSGIIHNHALLLFTASYILVFLFLA
jgi:hypothetical protein